MKWRHCFVVPLLASVLAGCGASRSAEEGGPRRQANVLSAEEIQNEARSLHAFDLIRALRPNWLHVGGPQSLGRPSGGTPTGPQVYQPMVYLDGSRMGPPEMLRQILAASVQEARFLSATEASSRFGYDHLGGAILITTRR